MTRTAPRSAEITWLPRVLSWVVAAGYCCLARRRVEGLQRLPADGACVVVPNHVTEIDPLTVALTVIDAGRVPRFLAKESLFRIPVLGALLHRTRQVPVHRSSHNSVQALASARERLDEGGCVVVYPEGTLTGDPLRWPMHGYPGAARLALALGVPLIPMAHWGDHEILGRDADRRIRLNLRPRRTVRVRVGRPVDLSPWRPDPQTMTGLAPQQRLAAVPHRSAVAATEAVLDAIAAELAVLRDEPVPPVRWDSRRKDYR